MKQNETSSADRVSLARYGQALELFTIAWAATETVVALWSARKTGSLSLAGFGWDSLIEVTSAVAVWWRMSHEMNHHRRHQAERLSLRISGSCLAALAVFITLEACMRLYRHEIARVDISGIVITAAAMVVMPFLSSQKNKVGQALSSNAMMTDAKQTDFCMYQAAIVLVGLLSHAYLGVDWADSAAALVLVPILVRAAYQTFRGEHHCTLH